MTFSPQHSDSVLFVTLDSCRLDTFLRSATPNFDRVAPCHSAWAPSHFTFGSHAAMFVGFTPSVREPRPHLNAKMARIFRLDRAGHAGHAAPAFTVTGRNIVAGFRDAGHHTVGTAAMAWFDPETAPSASLISDFETYHFGGRRGVRSQVAWLEGALADADRPTFTFLNVGETHVPYHFEGAPWPFEDNPCVPFQTVDRSQDCALRQQACLEYVDGVLGPLLDAYAESTVLICGDHGDCWGEDGLWEHGISHPKTLEVPLLLRHRGHPVE